jgi:hypothetical protein
MKPKNKASKRVLCTCRGGNSRSVGMAYALKYFFGHDAIACGVEGNDPETVTMLCNWAQIIICMRPEFKEKIPSEFWHKTFVCDVGYDRYFQPHPDLIEQCSAFIEGHYTLKKIVKD